MMKRIGIAVAGFLVITMVSLGFALYSETGLKLVVRAGEQISGGRLTVGEASGRLGSTFSVQDLHYVDSALSVRIGSLAFSWSPRALLGGKTHIYYCNIDGLHIASSVEESSPASTPESFIPADIELPLTFSVDEFELEDFQFKTSEETVAHIQRLDLKAGASATQLKIDALRVVGDMYDLELQGTLGMANDWPIDMTGRWKYTQGEFPELQGSGQLSGSLVEGRAKIKLNSPYDANLTGRFSLDKGVSWQALLQAGEVDPAVLWPEVSGSLNVEAELQGEYKGDSFEMGLSIAAVEGILLERPVHLTGDTAYDGKNIEIKEMHLKSGDARLRLNGDVGSTLALVYNLHVPDIDKIFPGFQGELQAEGKVNGSIEQPVTTANLEGKAFKWQGFSVDSLRTTIEAELAPAGEIKVTGIAEEMQKDTLALKRMELGFIGNPADHQVTFTVLKEQQSLKLEAQGGWAEGRWQGDIVDLQASYPGEGLLQLDRKTPLTFGPELMHLANLCLSDDNASLCFTGQMEDSRWQTDLELTEIDPAIFFPQWPGNLSASVEGNGKVAGDDSIFLIHVKKLGGEVRGAPVTGGGRVEQTSDKLDFSDIEVHYGDSQVLLNGYLANEIRLKFSLDIPDMGELFPQIQGTFSGAGEISGDRHTPAIDLNFSGKDLQADELGIGSLRGDIVADLRSDGNVAVDVQGENITSGMAEIKTFAVQAEGSAAEHEFTLKAMSEPGEIKIAGNGSYESQWSGMVDTVDVSLVNYGNWHLRESSGFILDAESGKLEYLCLQGESAAFCLQGGFDQSQRWQVEAEAESFPLQLLHGLGFTDMVLEGELGGFIRAAGQNQTISKLSAQAAIPLLQIEQNAQDAMQYQLSETSGTLSLAGDVLELKLSSKLMQDGALRGNIRIEPFNGNFQDITTQSLLGEFTVNVSDLSFISIVTNGRLESTGNLVGDVDLGGSLTRPQAKGQVVLKNGVLAITDLGIELNDLDLRFESSAEGADFILDARSGPGELQGSGNISFADDQGLLVQSEIAGKDFEIINTSEYVFRVSPDLKLDYTKNITRLHGNLVIPYARIVISNDQSVVRPSKDIVIVDDTEQEQDRLRRLYTDVKITLGNDVKVDAYGLRSDLQGSFRLLDEPGKNLSANGNLSVTNGTFSFYSVSLDITRGRLFFSGGGIENPGVDARAIREVGGNTVGIDITGTAQDLQFELFSEPFMEESNILSYILAGRPMHGSSDDSSLFTSAAVALGIRGANTITNRLGEYLPIDEIYLDKGDGEREFSVVVGKNVTENLFIGYDQSLLNGSGEVIARYELGRNFSIETKNSVNSTSGDIIYTIER